jgi:HSP20 family protein
MLHFLKQTAKKMGCETSRALDRLSGGWRELLNSSNKALTNLNGHKDPEQQEGIRILAAWPSRRLLVAGMEAKPRDVVACIDLPGMEKDDRKTIIEGNMLYLSGEKRFQRDTSNITCRVMKRACGTIQRSFILPGNVNIEKAEASFRNGVLMVRLHKGSSLSRSSIPVS